MAQSLNTVAARLGAEVGGWRVVRTAKRLGIHSKLHDRPSIALGTAEVNLLELTGAYTPFANGGQGVMPHIIQRVRNGDGKVLYQRQRSTTGQVVALPYVAEMNDMLNTTVTRGTGRARGDPGPDRRRQDRHDAELARCLVRRLHRLLRGGACGSATTTARRCAKSPAACCRPCCGTTSCSMRMRTSRRLPLPGHAGADARGRGGAASLGSRRKRQAMRISGEPLYRRVIGIFGGNG